MTTKRQGSQAAAPRPAVTALGELADEVTALGDDLAYQLDQLEASGVELPIDFAANADNALRRALDDLSGLVEDADGLLPRPEAKHRQGHAPGGHPPRGRLPAKRG